MIITRSEWEEGKKWILQSLAVYASLVGAWNTEMTAQSKLDPFSCIVVHGPKKRPASLLWKGKTSGEKIQGEKCFCHIVDRVVVEVYLCQKILGGQWHFNG